MKILVSRLCDGIGSCLNTCNNYLLPKNLKNGNDIHLCKVNECHLSWLNSETPLCISIQGSHNPTQYVNNTKKISNLCY